PQPLSQAPVGLEFGVIKKKLLVGVEYGLKVFYRRPQAHAGYGLDKGSFDLVINIGYKKSVGLGVERGLGVIIVIHGRQSHDRAELQPFEPAKGEKRPDLAGALSLRESIALARRG